MHYAPRPLLLRDGSDESSSTRAPGPVVGGEAPAPRPSCTECVEKHLGSAMVLMAEVRAGYLDHRMYAIGHLAEAEAESQAWLELHDAIREARRAYQQHDKAPDFARLSRLVQRANRGELASGPVVGAAPTWTTSQDVDALAARVDGSIRAFDAEASSKAVTEDWDPDAQQALLDKWAETYGGFPGAAQTIRRMQDRIDWARKARVGKSPEQAAKELEWGRSWRAFVPRWDTFLAQPGTDCGGVKWCGGVVEQRAYWAAIEAFETELTELRKRYGALGYAISTPPPPTSEDIAKEHPAPPTGEPAATLHSTLDTVKAAVPWVAGAVIVAAIAGAVRR